MFSTTVAAAAVVLLSGCAATPPPCKAAGDHRKGHAPHPTAALYERCLAGEGDPCAKLGRAFAGQEPLEDLPSDPSVALYFFTRACEHKSASGCRDLAVTHEHGRGTPLDYERAEKFFAKSCQLGAKEGCAGVDRLTEMKKSIGSAPLAPDNISKKIATSYLGDFKECHGRLLKVDPSAGGKVVVTLNVSEAGIVSSATAKGFDDLVDNCIAVKAQSWRFTASDDKKEHTFTIPIFLKPLE